MSITREGTNTYSTTSFFSLSLLSPSALVVVRETMALPVVDAGDDDDVRVEVDWVEDDAAFLSLIPPSVPSGLNGWLIEIWDSVVGSVSDDWF